MKRTFLWLLAAVCLQGLAACAIQGNGTSVAGMPASPSGTSQTLTAYHWLLQPDFDPNRKPVQLTFQDQRLNVQGLCNNMGASYSLGGQEMVIKQVASTMRLCDDPALMKYEQRIGKQLEKVSTWAVAGADTQQGPTLTLTFQDGQQWLLHSKQTHEDKYGPAETLFLEIQSHLAPCHHPLAHQRCLQTRTVSYNADGLKQSQGEWQLFYGDIEGYTHTDGVRNILRVKRYTRTDAPADASRYVYVLDMTVESENMQ